MEIPTIKNHSVSSLPDPDVLYQDGSIKLTPEGITISRYFFPTGRPKFIRWESIRTVQTAEDAKVSWYELKVWGLGFGNIWWNCRTRIINEKGVHGLDDILRSNLVIKTRNSLIRSGVYVEDTQTCLKIIDQMLVKNHLHYD